MGRLKPHPLWKANSLRSDCLGLIRGYLRTGHGRLSFLSRIDFFLSAAFRLALAGNSIAGLFLLQLQFFLLLESRLLRRMTDGFSCAFFFLLTLRFLVKQRLLHFLFRPEAASLSQLQRFSYGW